MVKFDNEKKPVLGIDLGTTYSAISRWTEKGPKVYQSPKGGYTIASAVYFDPRQTKPVVGNLALTKAILDPENAVIGVKRKMDNGHQILKVGGTEYTPIDISSIILKDIFEYAERTTPGFSPSGVVVTVPYYFTALQRQNTIEAAEQAGLNVLGIIEEPIAAALAYGLHEEDSIKDETILVFDLGGGTFDLTIFRLINSKDKLSFEVLATGGDDRLGGLDFDKDIANLLLQKSGLNLDGITKEDRLKADRALLDAAKETKETLSFEEFTDVTKPNILPGQHIEVDIERHEIEKVLKKYFTKMDFIIDTVLEKASVSKNEIDRVIKVGGSSRIPKIDELLIQKIGINKVHSNIDPDLCVAQGASVYAAFRDERLDWSKEIEIKTATAHDLGIRAGNDRFSVLIPGNRKTPCEATRIFTTNIDDCEELDVDVFQGSSPLLANNMQIGKIRVGGLLRRPAGELDIKITFKVTQQQAVSVEIEQKESNIRKVETVKLS